MASQDREDPVQELIRQYLPTETLSEARNLLHRFQEGEAFKLYVLRRIWLVIPVGLVIVLVSLACAAATVLFFAAGGSWLALPAFVLAPFILIGSLFVQLYVFFSWLESRALAKAFRRRARPVPTWGRFLPCPGSWRRSSWPRPSQCWRWRRRRSRCC